MILPKVFPTHFTRTYIGRDLKEEKLKLSSIITSYVILIIL